MSDYTVEDALALLGVKMPPRTDASPLPDLTSLIGGSFQECFWGPKPSSSVGNYSHLMPSAPPGRIWAGNEIDEWAEALQHDCNGWRPLMVSEAYHAIPPLHDTTHPPDQYWNKIKKIWVVGSKNFVINSKHLHPMRTTRPIS